MTDINISLDVKRLDPLHINMGVWSGSETLEKVLSVSQNVKHRFAIWTEHPFLDIYLEDLKT